MYKCLFSLMLVASVAQAGRILPPQGTYGELSLYSPATREAKIDDKKYTLAPGLRVLGTQNTLLMPAAIPQKAYVWYQIEGNTGFLWRMWILTEAEYQQYKHMAKPTPTPTPAPTATPTPTSSN